MWKHVGQSIKDSVELCSHIKNLRSTFSTCHAKTIQESNNNNIEDKNVFKTRILTGTSKTGRIYNVWMHLDGISKNNKNPFDINTPYVIQKCHQRQKEKQRRHHHCPFTLLKEWNAIQWVNTETLFEY